ncbi:MAG: sigma-70 family RNA polymerase sigma factor [Pseudomonadota bacterium]
MAALSNEELTALVQACAMGDRAAFRSVFDATQSAVYSVIFKKVRDGEAARSIMQKGYLYIWRNASKFDPERGSAIAWIMVIMRSRALDHLRRAARDVPSETVPETLIDPQPGPEVAVTQAKLNLVLRTALSQLPEKLRQAVELHFLHDMTSTEIGARLKISRHTAKSRIRRGVDALRHHVPIKAMQDWI